MDLPTVCREAGYILRHVEAIGSTNEAALAALLDGADRLWIVADEQIAGRGRHGRAWVSPKGNLYASLALDAPAAPEHLPQLGFVTGVALARAVTTVAPGLSFLKWPNDLMIGSGKCAGLLAEGGKSARGQGIAIGIGVNIAHAPAGLGRPVAHLSALLPDMTPARFFPLLAQEMTAMLRLFDRGAGFAAIRAEWLKHSMPLGAELSVSLPTGSQAGRFGGIDSAGHLLLETEAGRQTILAGDVFLVDEVAHMRTDVHDETR